jgi:hypothetical protein
MVSGVGNSNHVSLVPSRTTQAIEGVQKADEAQYHAQQKAESENAIVAGKKSEGKKILEDMKPTLLAIPEDEIRTSKAGAMKAVQCGFSYSNALVDDKPAFLAELSSKSRVVPILDDIRNRAVAFWIAQILLRRCENELVLPIKQLLLESESLRERLLESLKYLWRKDAIKRALLKDISAGRSRIDKADDLARLNMIFNDHWTNLNGRCDVEKDDVERSRDLSEQLLSALSGPQEIELYEVQDLRNRAYEHLRRGIDDIRHAAKFVFRDQPRRLKRYPLLHSLGRKKRAAKPAPPPATETPIEQPEPNEEPTPAIDSETTEATTPSMVN